MKKTYIIKANSYQDALKQARKMSDNDFDIGTRSKLNGAKEDVQKCIDCMNRVIKDASSTGDRNYETVQQARRALGELRKLLMTLGNDERYQSEYGTREVKHL